MNPIQFDRLTRVLAGGTNRRALLRRLSVLAAGGLVARTPHAAAADAFPAGAMIDAVVVACPVQPFMVEPPPPETTADRWLKIWEYNGQCGRLDGIVVNSTSSDGQTTSCTSKGGQCRLSVGGQTGPLILSEANAPTRADLRIIKPTSVNDTTPGTSVVNLVNLGISANTGSAPTQAVPDSGLLAYAVKNNGHWDIWLHDLAAAANTQLTDLPESDQWAPAWSHAGDRIAYLSDQTDGTNQVWLMDPDGKNQRQLTKHGGSETIAYVAWSPKDDQFIVTMQSSGGAFSDFIAAPASFATASPLGLMAYVFVQDGVNAVQKVRFEHSHTGIPGTVALLGVSLDAPSLDIGGHTLILQKGGRGARRLVVFSDRAGAEDVPAVGIDASNPVWTNKGIVFVSSDGTTESLIYMPFQFAQHFVLPIAPHENVWYLAARVVLPS